MPTLERVGSCVNQRLTEPYPKVTKSSGETLVDRVQETLKGLFLNSEQDKIFQSCETLRCLLFYIFFTLYLKETKSICSLS